MGNTPLTIGLKVDDNEKSGRGIMAGSILRGRIHLSNQDRKEVPGSLIRLKVIGIEEAVVYRPTREMEPGQNTTHGGQQNRSKNQDYYKRTSNTICHVDHTMKEYPGGVVPRGKFEFPFALQLPLHLPSTAKVESYSSHCEVRYEVIAEVFQKSNSQVHTNPHAKERLTVIGMPRTFALDHNFSRNLPIEIIPIFEWTYRNPLAFGAEQHSREGVAADYIQQSYHRLPPFNPTEDEPSGWETAATAPSAVYDNNSSVQMVQAQLVLPEDWIAHAEEIVNIPFVEATVLEQ